MPTRLERGFCFDCCKGRAPKITIGHASGICRFGARPKFDESPILSVARQRSRVGYRGLVLLLSFYNLVVTELYQTRDNGQKSRNLRRKVLPVKILFMCSKALKQLKVKKKTDFFSGAFFMFRLGTR